MVIQDIYIRLTSIDSLQRTSSSKAKYLNFLGISVVAFDVCNLNQIGTKQDKAYLVQSSSTI